MMEPSSAISNNETLTFRDGTNQWDVGPDRVSDYTRYMTPNSDTTLAKFFERPVLIGTYTWTPGVTPFFQTINPWTLFFSNKRVVNRINNFKVLNSNLNVKFVINGNPFYYGRLMVDYLPLYAKDAVTDSTGLTTKNLIQASQRIHGFLDPALSGGCTLKLPFVWPDNGVDITTAEWTQLGRCHIREMNVLKHANAGTTPVTINVFAWASEVSLSVPTTVNSSGLVVQASEIDMKPSSLASSASILASRLSNVPIIGPYMKATEMVTSSLGSIAKMFGYSRPVVIDEPSPMKPVYVGELACTDKKENVSKLTADSRQELTIDPSVIGVSLPDELAVNYIASKESYLTQFPWTIAATEGTHLWNVKVSPAMYDLNGSSVHMSALCFAALPFRAWRGTIKYRFQIVASGYHKGRLLFVYDPNYITGLETNVVYSRIVDLEMERDFTIDVAWAQTQAYRDVAPLGAVNFSTTAYNTTDNSYSNGVLGVYVLNSLTSPNSVTNNDIGLNVFVSACEDIDFVEPTSIQIRALSLVSQSEEVDAPENAPTSTMTDECMSKCIETPDIHSVFYGERFPSFRALLRRYCYQTSFTCGTAAIGRYTWVIQKSDYPVPRGVLITAGGYNNVGAANYTVTSLLNYLTPAFVAQRGGIRWKYVLHEDGSPDMSTMFAVRSGSSAYSNSLTLRTDTSSDTFMKSSANGNLGYAYNAANMTVAQHQPVLEVELPFYKKFRFCTAKDPSASASTVTSPIAVNGHILNIETRLTATTDRSIIDSYVSVAEDFQLMWFQGAPLMYIYAIP